MCLAKHLILTVALHNYTKLNFKRLYKTFPTYFSRIFLKHFSNRHANVKTILVYHHKSFVTLIYILSKPYNVLAF